MARGARGFLRSDDPAPTNLEDGGPLDTEETESDLSGSGSHSDPSTDSSTSTESDGKKPKKTDEQKAADFSRLASSRATDALKAITLLGHLANPAQYLWTAEQEATICNALVEKVDALRAMFEASRAPQEGKKRPKQLLISV